MPFKVTVAALNERCKRQEEVALEGMDEDGIFTGVLPWHLQGIGSSNSECPELGCCYSVCRPYVIRSCQIYIIVRHSLPSAKLDSEARSNLPRPPITGQIAACRKYSMWHATSIHILNAFWITVRSDRPQRRRTSRPLFVQCSCFSFFGPRYYSCHRTRFFLNQIRGSSLLSICFQALPEKVNRHHSILLRVKQWSVRNSKAEDSVAVVHNRAPSLSSIVTVHAGSLEDSSGGKRM